ncbi:MAG: ABC transporter permease [Dethiobacter sp.]|jgi:peptide/nickel transport system permease protein|nr:ABC transporter permease [Dethiobacter sp.]MBS3983313.1 ABC transporter permease [Dethiobacter sp.]MCL4462934.1 ABC transporter permease [Bacillota bacterium]
MKSGLLYDFWRAFHKNRLAALAGVILLAIFFLAIFAPVFATHNPTYIRLEQEQIKLPPTAAHFIGTDNLGRDIWSRMLFGARISLLVGFLTMIITVIIGVAYGAVSGYYGGKLDFMMMCFVDILLSLPTIFLVIILAAFFKPDFFGIAAIIGMTSWMRTARLVRGQFLSLKEEEFVMAARALGYSNCRIIFVHLLPNVRALIIINATLLIAQAVLLESALSFLGFGVQPPQFSWGSMLSSAQYIVFLKEAPWTAFFPGLAIFITVLCFNFFGEGLRDAWDPKLKNY